MKCFRTIILLVFVLCNASELFAFWSVLEDDPRPREPKHCYQVFTKDQWKASNFAKEEDLKWFRDAKYGMFVHFGLSTYKQKDLSWGICKVRKLPDLGEGRYPTSVWTRWADEFELPEFDAAKLVGYAKDAGMKYIVVIAKHHDGFHMWDTEFSDFKITNTPFGRDFVKEVADACHKAGMKFGVYYSQRDWYHPDYCPVDPNKITAPKRQWTLKPGETSPMGQSHKKYIKYQYNVCRELCTKYDKLDVFWFDAVWFGGMFNAEMWDSENLTRMIRKLQPGIIINNRASVPGDFDTPEQEIGMFQNHRPWESCITLCRTWSYSNTPTKSPKEIIKMLVNTLTGDGNILMSWGAQWSGEFHPDQVNALKQAGSWIKKNAKAIYSTRGGPWRPGKWGGSVYRDKTVYLHILSLVEKDKLVLSGLKQKVLSAKIHGGINVKFNQTSGKLEIILPAEVLDAVDTIVELTLDAPVSEIAVNVYGN
jgi:alpha-L-fucosidase